MADFRRQGKDYDPAFSVLRFGVVVFVDLYGGGDPSLPNPVLDLSVANPDLVWLEEVASPGGHLRRFRLMRKAKGTTQLTATQGSPPATFASLKLEVATPAGGDKVADALGALALAGCAVARKYQLPPSIMLGQAGKESTFGTLGIGARGINNFHGIAKKAVLPNDWYPKCQSRSPLPTITTTGQPPVTDTFCRANSIAEGVEIWGQFVSQNPHRGVIGGLLKNGPWTRGELMQIANQLPNLPFGDDANRSQYGTQVMQQIDQWGLMNFDIPPL